MMLKALPLVHFWNVLLLKEQMMTSVRKTLKTLSEICLENNHKIGCFLPIAFWWIFSPEIPAKFPGNRPIFLRICQKPCLEATFRNQSQFSGMFYMNV